MSVVKAEQKIIFNLALCPSCVRPKSKVHIVCVSQLFSLHSFIYSAIHLKRSAHFLAFNHWQFIKICCVSRR